MQPRGDSGMVTGEKRQRILVILNDPAYGNERTYNGLRLAGALAKREGVQLRLFLIGDAVTSARAGQQPPTGYYNLERMLQLVVRSGGEVGVCGTCIDARGLPEEGLTSGVRRSSLSDLASWTDWAEKVVTF